MLSKKLKDYTLSAHKKLESHPLFYSIAGHFDKSSYTQLLAKLHAYYTPLEKQYVSFFQNDTALTIENRKRAYLLANDLRNLSSSIIAPCTDVPLICTPAQALGALYVIEGSTLGAKFIYKTLSQAGIDKENGASYFFGYGDQTGSQWSVVVDLLNEITDEQKQREVIESANAVFTTLYNWLDKND